MIILMDIINFSCNYPSSIKNGCDFSLGLSTSTHMGSHTDIMMEEGVELEEYNTNEGGFGRA